MPRSSAAVVTASCPQASLDSAADSPMSLKERETLNALKKELSAIHPVVPHDNLPWLACVEMAIKVNGVEAALVAYVNSAIWLDARRLNSLIDAWFIKTGISRVKNEQRSVTSTLAFLRKFHDDNVYHWQIRYILMTDCSWPPELKAQFYRTIERTD